MFLDNFEVLAMHPSQYGETDMLEMKIYLVPGAIPYKSRLRPLNPEKENLRDQIDEWLEQGVVEPSVSPWASPLVHVTVKDSYPLMNIQEILHSLQGDTVFSFLDACGAYHEGRIKPGSPSSPFCTFQYIQMLWIS